MAEITNIPYSTIAIAAILGSLLYFLHDPGDGAFRGEAASPRWLRPVGDSGLGRGAPDAHLLIPVFVLVGLLGVGYSPTYSAFIAILSLWPVSWLRRHTRSIRWTFCA